MKAWDAGLVPAVWHNDYDYGWFHEVGGSEDCDFKGRLKSGFGSETSNQTADLLCELMRVCPSLDLIGKC